MKLLLVITAFCFGWGIGSIARADEPTRAQIIKRFSDHMRADAAKRGYTLKWVIKDHNESIDGWPVIDVEMPEKGRKCLLAISPANPEVRLYGCSPMDKRTAS